MYEQDYYKNQEENLFEFSQKDVRLGFIRKVYLILATQLTVTAAIIGIGLASEAYRQFMLHHVWTIFVALALNIVCIYAIYCTNTCGRQVPYNYICASIFTVTEAYIFSSFTSFLDPEIVFIAAVLTAAMTISLTIYAMTTKTDVTYCGGFLFMLCIMLIVGGILSYCFNSKVFAVGLSIVTIMIFGLYVIYDTQLIMGDRKRKLSTDDYIIAATSLYIDIMRIFLEVLKILAATQKR